MLSPPRFLDGWRFHGREDGCGRAPARRGAAPLSRRYSCGRRREPCRASDRQATATVPHRAGNARLRGKDLRRGFHGRGRAGDCGRRRPQPVVVRTAARAEHSAGYRAGDHVPPLPSWKETQRAGDTGREDEGHAHAARGTFLVDRGSCVPPHHVARAAPSAPGHLVNRPHEDVSGAAEEVRAQAQLRRHADRGPRARAGGAGGPRYSCRQVQGTTARHPVGCQGSVCDQRYSDHVGCCAFPKPGFRPRRDRGRTTRRRRRGARRKAVDGRARSG